MTGLERFRDYWQPWSSSADACVNSVLSMPTITIVFWCLRGLNLELPDDHNHLPMPRRSQFWEYNRFLALVEARFWVYWQERLSSVASESSILSLLTAIINLLLMPAGARFRVCRKLWSSSVTCRNSISRSLSITIVFRRLLRFNFESADDYDHLTRRLQGSILSLLTAMVTFQRLGLDWKI